MVLTTVKTSAVAKCRGQISGPVLFAIIVALVAILLFFYVFFQKPEPEPVPAPARPLETVEPAESAEERGDTAREIIDALSASADGVNYEQGYARAQEFQSAGRLADAQLLYFFAARGGHAPAAFTLATFYDPNHHTKESSLMDEPDPFQAYKWYREAEDAGYEDAAQRLAELKAWVEDTAQSGDSTAERLLLQWE